MCKTLAFLDFILKSFPMFRKSQVFLNGLFARKAKLPQGKAGQKG